MSFGDGNLHVKAAKLQERVDSLETTNGKLCDEINRQERVIERQAERIAELERSLEHYRLEVICYENDVDRRDTLIHDMARELRSLNDGGISTDCMEHERRMRELGIEVD